LHALFIERYPEWSDLTEQTPADQCRVIKRNRLVPDLIANNVKEEVERERSKSSKLLRVYSNRHNRKNSK
jgi:hypothetical protein